MPILWSISSKQDFYYFFREAFEEIRRKFSKRSTVGRENVPPIFREPHIMSGYRPNGRSYSFYIRSFFMLHNESMNVWTHFFGAFIILRVATNFYKDFESTMPYDTSMIILFASCSLLLHFVSAGAHLLHNHSENGHCIAFYFDNAAVGISAAAVNLIQFCYAALPEHFATLQNLFPAVLIVSAVVLSTCVSYALGKYRREYDWKTKILMFGPTGVFYLLSWTPIVFKLYRYFCGDHSIDFQWHHLNPLWLFAIAANFYLTCFPECAFPGQFDIFGHSHQIFHIFISVSHAAVIHAVRIDIETNRLSLASRRNNPFQIEDIISAFITMTVVEFVTVILLSVRFNLNLRESKSRSI